MKRTRAFTKSINHPPFTLMKTAPSLLAVLATVLALSVATPVFAASYEEVLDTLHQAEQSTAPQPLLQKAKEQLQHFNASVRSAGGARAHNHAASTAAREHKETAMKKIDEAIADASASQPKSVVEKIHAAIAEIHLAAQNKD
jgi:flagellar biosynthesis protein FliP